MSWEGFSSNFEKWWSSARDWCWCIGSWQWILPYQVLEMKGTQPHTKGWTISLLGKRQASKWEFLKAIKDLTLWKSQRYKTDDGLLQEWSSLRSWITLVKMFSSLHSRLCFLASLCDLFHDETNAVTGMKMLTPHPNPNFVWVCPLQSPANEAQIVARYKVKCFAKNVPHRNRVFDK